MLTLVKVFKLLTKEEVGKSIKAINDSLMNCQPLLVFFVSYFEFPFIVQHLNRLG